MAPNPKNINVVDQVTDHSKTEDLCYEVVNGKRVVRKSDEAHASNLYAGSKKDEAKVTATTDGATITGVARSTEPAVNDDEFVRKGEADVDYVKTTETGATISGVTRQTEPAVNDDELIRKGEAVSREDGKELSENNYDDTDRNKVANIPSNTNNELGSLDTRVSTAEQDIENLEASQISGVLYFNTYALMVAADPTGQAGSAYKVIAEVAPNTALNGDYSSDGATYTQQTKSNNGVIVEGNFDATSGDTAYKFHNSDILKKAVTPNYNEYFDGRDGAPWQFNAGSYLAYSSGWTKKMGILQYVNIAAGVDPYPSLNRPVFQSHFYEQNPSGMSVQYGFFVSAPEESLDDLHIDTRMLFYDANLQNGVTVEGAVVKKFKIYDHTYFVTVTADLTGINVPDGGQVLIGSRFGETGYEGWFNVFGFYYTYIYDFLLSGDELLIAAGISKSFETYDYRYALKSEISDFMSSLDLAKKTIHSNANDNFTGSDAEWVIGSEPNFFVAPTSDERLLGIEKVVSLGIGEVTDANRGIYQKFSYKGNTNGKTVQVGYFVRTDDFSLLDLYARVVFYGASGSALQVVNGNNKVYPISDTLSFVTTTVIPTIDNEGGFVSIGNSFGLNAFAGAVSVFGFYYTDSNDALAGDELLYSACVGVNYESKQTFAEVVGKGKLPLNKDKALEDGVPIDGWINEPPVEAIVDCDLEIFTEKFGIKKWLKFLSGIGYTDSGTGNSISLQHKLTSALTEGTFVQQAVLVHRNNSEDDYPTFSRQILWDGVFIDTPVWGEVVLSSTEKIMYSSIEVPATSHTTILIGSNYGIQTNDFYIAGWACQIFEQKPVGLEIDMYDSLKTKSETYFNKNTFHALGDSTSWGAGSIDGQTSWADILNKNENFRGFYKLARNGNTAMPTVGRGQLSDQVVQVTDSKGIITCMIGVNDYDLDNVVGDVAAVLAKSYASLDQTLSFAEAYRYNMQTLKLNNTEAKIYGLLPMQTSLEGLYDIDAYRDAEIAICNYLCIPVIEMNKDSGMWIGESSIWNDTVHPNDKGYRIIAEYLGRKLK